MDRTRNYTSCMPLRDRWRFFHGLRDRCRDRFASELARSLRGYRRAVAAAAQLDECESLRVLRSAVVVGMTTTGAAKYQALVRQLGCRVLVMEEAAEVLEAHVLASITADTQQGVPVPSVPMPIKIVCRLNRLEHNSPRPIFSLSVAILDHI